MFTDLEPVQEKNLPTSIIFEMLRERFPALATWLNQLCRWSGLDTHFQVIKDEKDATKIVVHFFTNDHCYHLVARSPRIATEEKTGDDGYLGCTVAARKPRVGEEHTRGNDLSDGPYNEDTWTKILRDIVSYEIKPLEIQNLSGEAEAKHVA